MRHGMKVVWKLVKSKHNLESVFKLKSFREREKLCGMCEVERIIVGKTERERRVLESGVIGENGC